MIMDMLVIVFLAAFVFLGTKRGAMKMLLSALSFIVSMAVGIFIYRPISELLEGMGAVDGIAQKLADNIGAVDELPGIMRDIVSITETEGELAGAVAQAAVSVISFLAVVILVRIALFAVSLALGIAGKLPLIRQADGLLGGVAGFIEGAFVVLLVFGFIAVIEVFGSSGIAATLFEGSNLAVMIYDNNPILGMVLAVAANMN